MVSDPLNVPVYCVCGWTGSRRPAKVKARPCPWCDREVERDRVLERGVTAAVQTKIAVTIPERLFPPQQLDIEDEIADRKAPVPRIPNPYYLRTVTGEVQIFHIPAHRRRRQSVRRRRAAN